jgi:hypothetical protein
MVLAMEGDKIKMSPEKTLLPEMLAPRATMFFVPKIPHHAQQRN